ncbi:hypothetical protein DL96DRAFT_653888 [Flagelloscypha sp. PMI_526]|nr:hypothetical protein DL96DRAFT_653888 [Flagelloscypha sp. PMI_526]
MPSEAEEATHVQRILDKHLEAPLSSSSPKTTREELAEVFDQSLRDLEDNPEEQEWKCTPLYQDIFRRVKQNDPSFQPKLITLVKELKENGSNETWKALKPFGMLFRETWNGSVEGHGVEGWTRLNAFAARLTNEELLNFDAYGIWAMRYALEDATLDDLGKVTGKVNEGELNPEILDRVIPAAAAWVTYAGTRMWKLSFEEKEWPRMMWGGPRWGRDKLGYSHERWKLWKDRFRGFSERSDLESHEVARKAYQEMSSIEKQES